MQIDPVFLRRHYASLSDDAFLAIDPEDLVDDARRVYNEELVQRNPTRPAPRVRGQETRAEAPKEEVEEAAAADRHLSQQLNDGPEPDWMDDAAIATSIYSYPGEDASGLVDDARSALEAAEVPCYLVAKKPDRNPGRVPDGEYNLMVPSKRYLEASSVLENRMVNQEFVETWKAHFQVLDDDELRELDLDLIFGDLLDRIRQITDAYHEELESRK